METHDDKITAEVRRLVNVGERRRTIRLLRLERYLDQAVEYQHQVSQLLRQAIDAGYLPPGTKLPEPPAIPEMPDDD